MNWHYVNKKLPTLSALAAIILALSMPAHAQPPIHCQDINDKDIVLENKTITIKNNSDAPIYPVIDTSANKDNEWLMGCRRDNVNKYSQERKYRAYINYPQGIPAGASVTLTLPMYTLLPAGYTDKQITWWNGGRLFISDEASALEEVHKEDSVNPINMEDSLCAKDASNSHCDVTVFMSEVQSQGADGKIIKSTKGLPEDIPGQLTEFTFGDSFIPNGHDRRILVPDNVNYNISYVDHAYLPVAIAPKGNPYIGFTGSDMKLSVFREKIAQFLQHEGVGWPEYKLDKSKYPHTKIPGAYNVLVAQDVLTESGKAVQDMKDLWAGCVNKFSGLSPDRPACSEKLGATLKEVASFYEANLQRYNKYYKTLLGCSTPEFPRPKSMNALSQLAHIYGWVPFNEGCPNPKANALASPDPGDLYIDPKDPTKGMKSPEEQAVIIKAAEKKHHDLQMKYIKELQYSFSGFNPYVTLIHDEKYLNMDSYAFSIDDAVGFMSELGSGLTFTVGGSEGLGGKYNSTKFTYDRKSPIGGFFVSLGNPKGNTKPLWSSYGACVIPEGAEDCNVDEKEIVRIPPTEPGVFGFRIGTIQYPVKVEFRDMKNRKYSFVVNQGFGGQGNPEKEDDGSITTYYDIVGKCLVDDQPGSTWCGLKAYTKEDPKQRGTRSYISGGPPLP